MTSIITQADGTFVLPPRGVPVVGELKIYKPIIFINQNASHSLVDTMFRFMAANLPPNTPENSVKYIEYSVSNMDTSSTLYKQLHKVFSNMMEFLERQLDICVMCSSTIVMEQSQKSRVSTTCCGHTAPVLAFISYMASLYNEDYIREHFVEFVKSASCFFERVAYNLTTGWNVSAYNFYYEIDGTNYPLLASTDNYIFIFAIYCDTNRNTYHHFFTINKWINNTMYVMIFDSWAGKGTRKLWGRIMLGTEFKELIRILNTPITSQFGTTQRHNDVLKRNIYYESYFSIPHIDYTDFLINAQDVCYMVRGFHLNKEQPIIKDLVKLCLCKFSTPVMWDDFYESGHMVIDDDDLDDISLGGKRKNTHILATKRIRKINKKRKTYKNKQNNKNKNKKNMNKKRKTYKNKKRKPFSK